MTIKELFKQLERRNENNKIFNEREQQYYVIFSEMEGKRFKTYKEFMKYVRKEYVKDYIPLLETAEFIKTIGHSAYTYFTCRGVHESLEIYLEDCE